MVLKALLGVGLALFILGLLLLERMDAIPTLSRDPHLPSLALTLVVGGLGLIMVTGIWHLIQQGLNSTQH